MLIADVQEFLDDALRGYVQCALWSESFEHNDSDSEDHVCRESGDRFTCGTSLQHYFDPGDIANRGDMERDVVTFCLDNWAHVRDLDAEQVGYDFWLTRNHHGAGFWDRGVTYGNQCLTESSHLYGESSLRVGDDGRLYAS